MEPTSIDTDFGSLVSRIWADHELMHESPHAGDLAELRRQLDRVAPSDPQRILYWAEVLALGGRLTDAVAACERFVRIGRVQLAAHNGLRNRLAAICFRTQNFIPLYAFFRQQFDIDVEIEIRADINPGTTYWGFHKNKFTFLFGDKLPYHDYMEVVVKHWIQIIPLLTHYAHSVEHEEGEVVLNLEDRGTFPGLAYCDYRSGYFLIPDPVFVQSDAYASEKDDCVTCLLPWSQRKPVAFWRGQTTGWEDCQGNRIRTWRDLPRVRLCEIARSAPIPENFDVALSDVVQINDPQAVDEVRQSGLIRGYVPFRDYLNYKYQIDIDGNTSSWPGLFTKLCTGNPVLKVTSSKGYRQWYYDRLVPWYNYVPVEADMSDLVEKVNWAIENDEEARRIGERGRTLALQMTVEQEVARAVPTIAAAFRDAGQNRSSA